MIILVSTIPVWVEETNIYETWSLPPGEINPQLLHCVLRLTMERNKQRVRMREGSRRGEEKPSQDVLSEVWLQPNPEGSLGAYVVSQNLSCPEVTERSFYVSIPVSP